MPTLQYPIGADEDSCDYAETGSLFSNNHTNDYIGRVGTADFNNSFRFPGIYIANGATINSAYLKWTAASSQSSTTVNLRIYGNDVDNAAQPTVYNDGVLTGSGGNFVDTTANVAWSNVAAETAATVYSSPDIASIIQEIVNRAGWVSGNAIQLLVLEDGSSINAYREIEMQTPYLEINYTGDIVIPMSNTLTIGSTVNKSTVFSRGLTDNLTLSQVIAKNMIFTVGMTTALNITDTMTSPIDLSKTVVTHLDLTDAINSSLKGGNILTQLQVEQAIGKAGEFYRSIVSNLSLTSSIGRVIEASVTSNINFAQAFDSGFNVHEFIESITSNLNLTHSFTGDLSHVMLHELAITQTIAYNVIRSIGVETSLSLKSHPLYWRIDHNTLTSYSPFIVIDGLGADTLTLYTLLEADLSGLSEAELEALIGILEAGGIPSGSGDGTGGEEGWDGNAENNAINHPGGSGGFEEPPPLTGPAHCAEEAETATLTLTWPYEAPTTSLELRNPELGNTKAVSPTKLSRQSSGGTLINFRDGLWSKYKKLTFSLIGLTKTQADDLHQFFRDSAGDEIGLLDYNNVQWRGIILTPDAEIVTHRDDCDYRVDFEFEGEEA